ncbi:PREDICTED: uncharacterized protein LOC109464007 [Branchiostoma belcheri]|uniref:Uncharacterized protein LOC109464007 n=1 Tax=Branchiostoma belcheri TaxID=7741 RepID=A0A6P4XWN1_BRABE|nr:PREDICTED: uncharacterized protein LOC109464007 [Branchiostoma belcheri]
MKFFLLYVLLLLISALGTDAFWGRRRRRRLALSGCPFPPRPAYSSRSGCTSPYTQGEICHYECHPGYYQKSGNTDLTCTNRNWNGSSLVCTPFECSTPPTPANSYRRGCWPPFLHGDTCYYNCLSGYYQGSGNIERTCSSGDWTGSDLECKKESLFSPKENLDVEVIWTYQLQDGILPLFENWKKLPNIGIASRTTANVYMSALYVGRIELFGQASLRLKNVSLSDKGVYQLFTVFSDGTSQTVTASVEVDDPCENNTCSPDGGRCVPHGNNFTCMCDPGYVGDGRICTEVTTQSGTTIPTTNVMKEFPFGFTELQATAEIPPTIGDSAVTTAARKSSVRNTTAGSHSTLAGNGMTKTIQGSVRNTTAGNLISEKFNNVTSAAEGSDAEFYWNYQEKDNTEVIFEAWWFKVNGDGLMIASRVHPLNTSVSPRYEKRLEAFGDAGLLLRAVRLTDAGTYELLVAFDDASESIRKDSHLVVHYPPRFLDITPSVTAARGTQVILQAHASCIPPPTYSWIKVNGSVPETSIENTTTGTLTLRNIGQKDSGTYMAIASNSLGIASNLSVLKVENLQEDTSSEAEFSIEEVLTIAAVPCVTVLSVMAGVLLYCWIRKRRNKEQTLDMSEVTFHPDLPPLPAALPQPPPTPSRPQFLKYEINRTDLDVKERIGSGAFGLVFLASLRRLVNGLPTDKTVVVKTVHEDSGEEEIKNFIREIDTTMNLTEHINLLGLIGCVTVTRPPYMVTDYMPYGDLKNFLLKCRKTFISQAGYVHGDLAARNVLVGENLVVKIADFGLTTDIYERGYQRQDAEQKIPLRWMAPERLLREGRYTSKSDVWSFGVVLFEVTTLGDVPYPGRERTLLEDLRTGYREPCPPGLPQDMYSMMLRCWEWDEDDRPDFEELYQELDAVLESMTNGYMKPRCSWTDSWTEASENSGCSSSTEAAEPPGSSSSAEATETPGDSSSAEVLETPGRSSSIVAVETPGISSSGKNPQSSEVTETPGSSSSSEAAKNTGSSISTEAVEKPGSAYDIPRAARMRLQVATGICNGNGYHEELEMDSIRVRKHMSL